MAERKRTDTPEPEKADDRNDFEKLRGFLEGRNERVIETDQWVCRMVQSLDKVSIWLNPPDDELRRDLYEVKGEGLNKVDVWRQIITIGGEKIPVYACRCAWLMNQKERKEFQAKSAHLVTFVQDLILEEEGWGGEG